MKKALAGMKKGKAMGQDGIPVAAWKCLGKIGWIWLTKFFNKILRTKEMPDMIGEEVL